MIDATLNSQMRPVSAGLDSKDSAVMNIESFGDFSLLDTSSQHSFDNANLRFVQLGKTVTATYGLQIQHLCMYLIFLSCAILKVSSAVVLFIPINVIDVVIKRSRANERFGDEMVNKALFYVATIKKLNTLIARVIKRGFENSTLRVANLTKVRNLIKILKTGNRLPRFHEAILSQGIV